LGSKRHLICDGNGIPLVIQLTGANSSDSRQAISLVDSIPPLQGDRGRPRRRPDCVLGDRGYDAEAIRQYPAFPSEAKYTTRKPAWPLAVGSGTEFRLVEPVSPIACSL